MDFKFKKKYLIGITIGIFILVIDFSVYLETNWFLPILIAALSIGWSQFWIDFFIENNRQKEIENRFLDFVRNLSGAIKSGMPVSRAITHISVIDYGALSPYVKN